MFLADNLREFCVLFDVEISLSKHVQQNMGLVLYS